FARMELEHRSVQVDQVLAESMREKAKESQKRAPVPLTFRESLFAGLYGFGLGLFGLVFQCSAASRFKSNGYTLKHQKSWQLYWFFVAVRLIVLAIGVAIAAPSRPIKRYEKIMVLPARNDTQGPKP